MLFRSKCIEIIKPKKVYVFSSIDDGDYDNLKCDVMKVDLNSLILQTGCNVHDIYEQMEDKCLAVFDDILSFDNKILKLYIKLRQQCLAVGRHKGLSTICIEQQARNREKTRDVLLNSEIFIFFPKASFVSFQKTASEYLGLNKEQINKLKENSRYVSIDKRFPSYAVREHNIDLL